MQPAGVDTGRCRVVMRATLLIGANAFEGKADSREQGLLLGGNAAGGISQHVQADACDGTAPVAPIRPNAPLEGRATPDVG